MLGTGKRLRETEQEDALRRAADKVRAWIDRRIDEGALDIARLFRASRDKLVERLQLIYDNFLKDEPSIVAARISGANTALDQAIHDEINQLVNRVGEKATASLVGVTQLHPTVVNKIVAPLLNVTADQVKRPYDTVLGELTTTVTGGGTYEDRLLNLSQNMKDDLFGAVRDSLVAGSDFETLAGKVEGIFGIDSLPEPKANAYGSVQTYKNEARRQWNELMKEFADTKNMIPVWYAQLDENTTPGCAARHGIPLDELDDSPPRHYNCRCDILVVAPGTELGEYREEGDAWLEANGYTRNEAMLEESWAPLREAEFDPEKHPRDEHGRFIEFPQYPMPTDSAEGLPHGAETEEKATALFRSKLNDMNNKGQLKFFHEIPGDKASSVKRSGIKSDYGVFSAVGEPSQFAVGYPRTVVEFRAPMSVLDQITPDMKFFSYENIGPFQAILKGHPDLQGAYVAQPDAVDKYYINKVTVVHNDEEYQKLFPQRSKNAEAVAFDAAKHPRDEHGRWVSTGIDLDAGSKLYSQDFDGGHKIAYVSSAMIKGSSVTDAQDDAGATDEHAKAAELILDAIREAPESSDTLYRSVWFNPRMTEKQEAFRGMLDGLKAGDTLTMDRITAFSSDKAQAAYYGARGKSINYQIQIQGESKSLATDPHTGMGHSERLTEGKFEVTKVIDKGSRVKLPDAYVGSTHYSKTIVLKHVEVF